MQHILQGLHNLVMFRETREDKYGDIALFFRDWNNRQVKSNSAMNLLQYILDLVLYNFLTRIGGHIRLC